ncbi:MAG TPA: PAS domain S-box protein [Noviherbaspirillum sp.]|uniref:sensor domain-containing diguanylate cyclase n=1 Tax=Noviherbaspirillum sp. TaxID=1926288 RepID=UPI002B4606BB|nr:PAS domain S-box protein [Noviherbaspirillum sp.]HJV87936.1 PAS domain S-box protein [Noviherbaspirillum sp.]
MNSLIALCADFYWEQDTDCRFSLVRSTRAQPRPYDEGIQSAAGKRPWECADIIGPASWQDWRGMIHRRQPFRDVEWRWQLASGERCFLRVAGEPVFDTAGAFAGYRGVMHDITLERRREEEMRRFRAAVEVSGDPILLVDRETMRFIDMNETACELTGYSRAELMAMGPEDILLSHRQAIETDYDELIAGGGLGRTSEGRAHNRAGEVFLFEIHRRAIRIDGRWMVVSIGRDITRRKRVERAAVRIGQMYAAISGTNEAILHARSPDELYQQVCEVAVRGGQIVSASVLLPDPESEWARVAALAGVGADTLRKLRICFDQERPEGRGLVGTAFRSRKPCVINDFINDPRSQPWRQAAGKERAAAGAAFPLVRNGQSDGVLLLYSRDIDAFDDEIVQLLERMARDIVFALDNFERENERRKAVDALRESEEKYRRILEDMSDGYFEVDLEGNYTLVNDALCRLHRCTREEALQLGYRDYADPDVAATIYKAFNQVYRTGQPAELAEYPVRSKDGTYGIVQTSTQLILDASGKAIGFRGISRDITARCEAEEALRASEEKYRSILESIEEAYYEVDLAGTLMLCNQAFCRMFGYRMEELIGLNYSEYHNPGEVAYVFANFNEVFRTGVPKKGLDWQLKHKNGTTVLCEGSILLVRDDSGEPVGFRGMLRDVTARRQMEAALRASEERFRDLTELSSDWYWEQDNRFRFVQINGEVHARTGMAAEDYLGKTLWELPFDNVSMDQWLEHQGCLAGGQPFYELVLKTCLPGAEPRYLSVSGLPMRDAEGRLTGYRGTGKDITERKLAEERIRHLASHDILTGLPNRMMFNQMLSFQVQQARRYGRKFALMFIDLDHFKAVNDTSGHDAGDVLLKETAKRLSENMRASDFVARLAGDEFVVIVQEPGDTTQLEGIARKVIAALRMPVTLAGAMHQVTASVGICIFPDDGQDEDAILKHADAAMYAVKRGTKDSFRFYVA